MHKKVNILFLVDHFTMGGVQKSNVRMINNIDKSKFKVHVLYVNEGLLMEELTDDITISKLGSVLKLKSLVNVKYTMKTMKYIKQNNIEIVHTIDSILYFIGAIASHLINIIRIYTYIKFIFSV